MDSISRAFLGGVFSVSGVGKDCGARGPGSERCPPGSGMGKVGVSSSKR